MTNHVLLLTFSCCEPPFLYQKFASKSCHLGEKKRRPHCPKSECYNWRKTRWESRCGFLCKIPKQLPKTNNFSPWNTQHCVFQAEVVAIPEVAKNLLLEKMHNQSIVVMVDSQAAIKITY